MKNLSYAFTMAESGSGMVGERHYREGIFWPLLVAAGLGSGYYLLATLGQHVASVDGTVSIIWPATGLAVGLLYHFGIRYTVMVAIGSVVANVPQQHWPIAIGIGIGHAAGAALAVSLLRQRGFSPRFDRWHDARTLLFASAPALAFSAVNSAVWLLGAGRIGGTQFAETILIGFSGDLAGLLILAPLILAWPKSTRDIAEPTATASSMFAMLLLGGVIFLGFLPLGLWLVALVFVPFLLTLRIAAVAGAWPAALHVALLLAFVLTSLLSLSGLSHYFTQDSYLHGAWGYLTAQALASLMIAGVISERRQALKQLRSGEASYKALVEDNPALICRFHQDGHLAFANETFRRLLGVETGQTEGADFFQLSGLGAVGDFVRRLQESHASDPVITADCLLGGRWYRWSARSVKESSGQSVEFHAVGLDVTDQVRAEAERRRIESQAVQTQKLESVGVLASGIAHEFNNLLTAVLGNVELAQLTISPDSQAVALLDHVQRGARRAAELTHQLLNYSGRNSNERGPIDLSEVVRSVHDLLNVAVPKSATFRVDLAESLPLIEGNDGYLRQLLMSLISNAGEAVRDTHGTVTARTRTVYYDPTHDPRWKVHGSVQAGWHVLLQIEDTGTGMSPSIRGRAFEPFFSTKQPGRGLGLPAVLGIVCDHGGGIGLCSSPGRGTCVSVLFPASNPAMLGRVDGDCVHTPSCRYCSILGRDSDETPPEGHVPLPPFHNDGLLRSGWSSHVRSRSLRVKVDA